MMNEPSTTLADINSLRVAVIIPAMNEEQSIGQVIADIPAWVTEIIVADNGSTDKTADLARRAGAKVVPAPIRGYGSACLAGIAAAENADILVFIDGDFSDYPRQMGLLVQPIADNRADMVIGSRTLGHRQRGSLTIQQRFGGALACLLMRLLWSTRYTDLGPFRAISVKALRQLHMDDRNFGWTVQMQIRAAIVGLRTMEVPVDYRRRIGKSKISGTVRGVAMAGYKIIYTIGKEFLAGRNFSEKFSK
jgi:glycosyltransferase involved in cell wall biosynthesis